MLLASPMTNILISTLKHTHLCIACMQMTADLVTAYTYNWQHSSINGAVGRVETLQTFDFETGDEVLVPIPEGIAPSK